MLLPAHHPQIATAGAQVPEDTEVEEEEWQVDKITDLKWERCGQGPPQQKYLVKW